MLVKPIDEDQAQSVILWRVMDGGDEGTRVEHATGSHLLRHSSNAKQSADQRAIWHGCLSRPPLPVLRG
jgi:hypothetical protein